jgi:hypothetical protein
MVFFFLLGASGSNRGGDFKGTAEETAACMGSEERAAVMANRLEVDLEER